ncbi:MAG: hypothetical protein IRZ03_15710, partial [Acidobacterium ailaaui]|nr:hypothetical protein [Pseudacidobacterium ailaaui]
MKYNIYSIPFDLSILTGLSNQYSQGVDYYFNPDTDFISLYIFNSSNVLIYNDYYDTNFRVTSDNFYSGSIFDITVDVQYDAQRFSLFYGNYNFLYYVLRPVIGDKYFNFFVKDYDSINRIVTIDSLNSDYYSQSINYSDYFNSSSLLEYVFLDFGNNNLFFITDFKVISGEVKIKVNKDIPDDVIKSSFNVVQLILPPKYYNVSISSDGSSILSQNNISGPNFNIKIDYKSKKQTDYINYDGIVSGSLLFEKQSDLSSSYFTVNVDFSDFSSFVHFSNIKYRFLSFYNKLIDIENLYASSSLYNSDYFSSSLQSIFNSFTDYEKYMYFYSSSYSWPKQNNTFPYLNYSYSSSISVNFYNNYYQSASIYDQNNVNSLLNNIPAYIAENDSNEPLFMFLSAIGEMFDEIWLRIKSISDLYSFDSDINSYISKDIVDYVLPNLGIPIYSYDYNSDIDNYYYSSSLISFYDYAKSINARIASNAPLLRSTKGTKNSINLLQSIFGLPSFFNVYKFGNFLRHSSSFTKEIHNYKVSPRNGISISIPFYDVTNNINKTNYNPIFYTDKPDCIEFRCKPAYIVTSSYNLLSFIANNNIVGGIDINFTGNDGNKLGGFSNVIFYLYGNYSNSGSGIYSCSLFNVPVYGLEDFMNYHYSNFLIVNDNKGNFNLYCYCNQNIYSSSFSIYNSTNGYLNTDHILFNLSYFYVDEVRLWYNKTLDFINTSSFIEHSVNFLSIQGNNLFYFDDNILIRYSLGSDGNLNAFSSSHYMPTLNDIGYFYSGSLKNISTYYDLRAVINGNYNIERSIDLFKVYDSRLFQYSLQDNDIIYLNNKISSSILSLYSSNQNLNDLFGYDNFMANKFFNISEDVTLDFINYFGNNFNIDDYIGIPYGIDKYSIDKIYYYHSNKFIKKYDYILFNLLSSRINYSFFKYLNKFLPIEAVDSTGTILHSHPVKFSLYDDFDISSDVYSYTSSFVNYDGSYYISVSSSNTMNLPNYVYTKNGKINYGQDNIYGEYQLDSYKEYTNYFYNSFSYFSLDNLTSYSESIWYYEYNPIYGDICLYKPSVENKLFFNGILETSYVNDYIYESKGYRSFRFEGTEFHSDDYNEIGDNGYSVIDKNSSYFAYFVECYNTGSENLAFPERTNVYIKYLFDQSGNKIELFKRDYYNLDYSQYSNLYLVQDIFKGGDILNISLFNNSYPSNQKGLDGNKEIFAGGIRYIPMLWRLYDTSSLYYRLNPNVYTNGVPDFFQMFLNPSNYTITGYSSIYTQGFRNKTKFYIHIHYNGSVSIPYDLNVTVRIDYTRKSAISFSSGEKGSMVIVKTFPARDVNGNPNRDLYFDTDAVTKEATIDKLTIVYVYPGTNSSNINFILPSDDTAYLFVNPADT